MMLLLLLQVFQLPLASLPLRRAPTAVAASRYTAATCVQLEHTATAKQLMVC